MFNRRGRRRVCLRCTAPTTYSQRVYSVYTQASYTYTATRDSQVASMPGKVKGESNVQGVWCRGSLIRCYHTAEIDQNLQ
jgi:hypothetical protein